MKTQNRKLKLKKNFFEGSEFKNGKYECSSLLSYPRCSAVTFFSRFIII